MKLKLLPPPAEQVVYFSAIQKDAGRKRPQGRRVRRLLYLFIGELELLVVIVGMEGFWGLMKREMYYGKKYKTKEELMLAIEKYIDYYTNKRVQRNLGVLTPLEFHEQKLKNVA